MITGSVNTRLEATLRLIVRNPQGQSQEIEAILDTGFTGSLTLPPSTIAALGLPWRTRGNALLANGREAQFDIYAAMVQWDNHERDILIEAAESIPLIGMRLLSGYDVHFQAVAGGKVAIKALP